MDSKVIFIAIPTAGCVRDGSLTPEFNKKLAQLHLENPTFTFIAPMVQDYQMLAHMPDSAATWAVWGHHCEKLIPLCDEVWILMYDGWDTSVGVDGETKCAAAHNIPVVYIKLTDEEKKIAGPKPRFVGDLVELPRPTKEEDRVAFAASFISDAGNELRKLARDEALWLMNLIREKNAQIAELERENSQLRAAIERATSNIQEVQQRSHDER